MYVSGKHKGEKIETPEVVGTQDLTPSSQKALVLTPSLLSHTKGLEENAVRPLKAGTGRTVTSPSTSLCLPLDLGRLLSVGREDTFPFCHILSELCTVRLERTSSVREGAKFINDPYFTHCHNTSE